MRILQKHKPPPLQGYGGKGGRVIYLSAKLLAILEMLSIMNLYRERQGVATMGVLTLHEIESIVKELLTKYSAEYALLFGSYARGEATSESDIDLIVVGGEKFIPRNIFALAEDLRELTGRNANVYEMREVNAGTSFYESIMRDGIRIE